MKLRPVVFCLAIATLGIAGCRHADDQSTAPGQAPKPAANPVADQPSKGSPEGAPGVSTQNVSPRQPAPPAETPARDCQSNLKQVALAFMMLASDNDDTLKCTPSDWVEKAMPYMKDRSRLHCPDAPGDDVSYSFNPKLAGLRVMDVQSPADTVLVYEGKDGKLDFRHDGKASVAFLDGHVKQVDEAQANSLRWTP